MKAYTHYALDDGRYWDIKAACFVTELPQDAELAYARDRNHVCSIDGLQAALRFYGYELGELATTEELAVKLRKERNQKLAETDYLVMPDYPLAEDKKQAVLTYRQALRDITAQEGFPKNINWPELNS